MNNLWTDTGYISLNHVNEQLCGDRVEIIGNNEKSLTMVLADGLGSGVKANILSTLTSKIICTMMANGMPIEECVDTIAKTLPVCSVRQVAYSTFTIIRITDNTTAEIIQFDNPNVFLLRNGKSVDYPIVSRVIEGQVPKYKIFGGARGDLKRNPPKPAPSKGTGLYGTTYGLPRFREAAFSAAFPFAQVDFADSRFPLQVRLRAWSPFTPPEADDSSYPAAFLEYSFRNDTASRQDAVFYYAAMNFLDTGCGQASVSKYKTGFVLRQSGTQEAPWEKSDYCALIDDSAARVNTARGVACRAVAETLPPYVRPAEPTLEDAYLYLISGEGEA